VSFIPGKDPAPLIAAIEHVVADVGTTLNRGEVEAARRTWKETLLWRVQTSAGRAGVLSRWKRSGDPFDLAKYDSIDEAAVTNVVRSVLAPTHRVVMVTHSVRQSPWYGIVAHREEHAQ